jgi:hypothetical protein
MFLHDLMSHGQVLLIRFLYGAAVVGRVMIAIPYFQLIRVTDSVILHWHDIPELTELQIECEQGWTASGY